MNVKIKVTKYTNIRLQIKTFLANNIFILLSGTAISQGLLIVTSPILTRIFIPEDFGLYGLYTSCCSIMTVFACGRYDLAIIKPKHNSDARILLNLSVTLSIIFSTLLFIIVFFLNKPIVSMLGDERIGFWLYLMPLSIFTLSANSAFSFWLNRNKLFKDMRTNRIISSTTITILSLGIGISKLLKGGLIMGYIIGHLFTVFLLKKKVLENKYEFNLKRFKVLMKRYVEYPKYMIIGTLASEVSATIPLVLITTFYGSAITGLFTLASRVTSLPISFLGNAIGEVYRQKASEEYNNNGNCKQLYINTLKKLIAISVIPFFILFFFSEYLFVFFFGSNWQGAGVISESLAFLNFFQLISIPMSYTILLNKSQKLDMILQIFRSIFSVFAIIIGFEVGKSYYISIVLYVIVFSVFYLLHIIIQFRSASGYSNKISLGWKRIK
jgi:O-antigen/teichoic acid export membrane protein